MNDLPASKPGHRLEWLVWGALILTVLAIAAAFIRARVQEQPLPVLGPVPEFTLTNQFAQPISLSNLLGQVWVTDVIFTTCPVSCERMTQRMHALEKEIPPRAPVKFVSLSVNPAYDTPPVLKKYAERHGVDQARWHFLTGVKSNVYELGIHGFKFTVLDNTNRVIPDDLFLHSTQFAVVDKRGRIRGYFEGTEEEARRNLLLAVRKLARER